MAKEFVGQEYMAATHGKGLHQESRANRIAGRIAVSFSVFVSVLSVAIMAFCMFFAICNVDGFSMVTTLNATGSNADKVLTCNLGEPQRGDIVIFKFYYYNTRYKSLQTLVEQGNTAAIATVQSIFPERDKNGYHKYVVKRLIGKAGDKISMYRTADGNYYIYLNGQKLDESYLDPLMSYHSAPSFAQLWNVLNDRNQADMTDWVNVDYDTYVTQNQYTDVGDGTPSAKMLTVPNDHYFIIGDNREGDFIQYGDSWDGCDFGPLPAENYVSRCVDIIHNHTSLAEYLWQKFVYYVCFGWAWQK